MTTIIIIESEIVELNAFFEIFNKWEEKTNLLFANNINAAMNIIGKQEVDLAVCDLSLPGGPDLADLERMTKTFPYLPCLVILDEDDSRHLDTEVGFCLERPFDADQLLHLTEKLLKISTTGRMEGIPVHTLLQILDNEKKTCTLKVSCEKQTGFLYLKDGKVIGAELEGLTNEEAAYSILATDYPVIEIKYFNGQYSDEIDTPLMALIMEAFRIKDEQENLQQKEESTEKQHPRLKSITLRDKHLPINIGTRVKMDIISQGTSLMSTMVGMVENHFLIVTSPSSSEIINKLLESEEQIAIKFIYMGKLFMFKTVLLNTIDDPYHLLFLKYPLIVHLHELRGAKRMPVFIPCSIQLPSLENFLGTLLDMSIKGGLIQIKPPKRKENINVSLNDNVKIRCLIPGTGEEQVIAGQVKNLKTDSDKTRIGLEFSHLKLFLQEKIEQYLNSLSGRLSDGGQ